MEKTTFSVPKMDCPAEERLVRTALEGREGIVNLLFDLPERRLTVVHRGSPDVVTAALAPLNLGAEMIATAALQESNGAAIPTVKSEGRTLEIALAINGGMFVAEIIGAVVAQSSALLADSLDMFADAAVYGVAIFGVNRARTTQLKAARISGVLQLLLAFIALGEVVRRFLFGSEPEPLLIALVAVTALGANATTMWLLARHREGGAHMKASWIFTTTDVIANIGVIVSAGLVRLFHSNVPDLAVATLIALVVLNGAIRILRLR